MIESARGTRRPRSSSEPNRDVRNLEEPRQVVGQLPDLLSRLLVEGREHPDVEAELAGSAIIRPDAHDATVEQDDRGEPPRVLVDLPVARRGDEVAPVVMARHERVEAGREPPESL